MLSYLSRQLHTTTNFLLLSLAVSDFLVGFLMFFQIFFADGCWVLGDFMCAVYIVLNYITTTGSIGTTMLISVDRYVAICYPLHYSTKVTLKRVQICVCVCWTSAALCYTLLLKENLKQPGMYNSCSGECAVVFEYVAELADLFLSFIGPVTVIIALYMRVFVVAVSQARAMRSHIASVTLQRSVKVKKSEMKAARALGVVVVVFLMCFCPYFYPSIAGQDTTNDMAISVFGLWLLYFNSCLNPLIYAFFYPWFRKSIKLIVTLQILQPGSCEAKLIDRCV